MPVDVFSLIGALATSQPSGTLERNMLKRSNSLAAFGVPIRSSETWDYSKRPGPNDLVCCFHHSARFTTPVEINPEKKATRRSATIGDRTNTPTSIFRS